MIVEAERRVKEYFREEDNKKEKALQLKGISGHVVLIRVQLCKAVISRNIDLSFSPPPSSSPPAVFAAH